MVPGVSYTKHPSCAESFWRVRPDYFLEKFVRRLFFCIGKSYLCPAFQESRVDLVAQPVEHLTFNQGVMGSNPIEITQKSDLALVSVQLTRAFCFWLSFCVVLSETQVFLREKDRYKFIFKTALFYLAQVFRGIPGLSFAVRCFKKSVYNLPR